MFAKLNLTRAALVRVAAICVVALSAEATNTANAVTVLNFDFSFSNVIGTINGTVTGEIDRVVDNSTGPAFAVILDSLPTAFASICSTPCNTTMPPWLVFSNSFEVLNHQLFPVFFDASEVSTSGQSLELVLGETFSELFAPVGDVIGPAISTTPPTPLPAALPLFASGLGAFGLLGWRRKRKAVT